MIAIIDYGAGNVESVKKALDYLRIKSIITDDKEKIIEADKVILPGVGNFGDVMQSLRKKELDKIIIQFIESGKQFLGICIGLQILFEESEENPGVKGLDILKGKVVKFKKGKVPQIGWNKINEGYVYFVNSYYVVPEDESIVTEITDYYGEFVSGVKKDNITAVQFHPEKSGKLGLDILRRWLSC